MKKRVCASAFLAAIVSSAAVAGQVTSPAPSWTGFYLGANIGSELGSTDVRDPFGPSIYGDNVTAPGFAYGLQGGYNWQKPGANWVLGAEAELGGVDAVGHNTCFAFSGSHVPSNCTVAPSVAGALTARAGYALGRSLVYAKGGLALLGQSVNETENGAGSNSTASNRSTLGWTLGGGVEYALTNAWSLKVEYDYSRFASVGIYAPLNTVAGQAPANPGATTSATTAINQIKLGLNYNFDRRLPSLSQAPLFTRIPSGWAFEFGGRDWLSTGRFQKRLTPSDSGSQLTYANIVGDSGEIFGRIDSPSNLFLKGFAGLGGFDSGRMNDEDFLLPVAADLPTRKGPLAYSNTVSNAGAGALNYATIDLGYDFATGAGYKLGAFAGYNMYHDEMKAYGCSQIANSQSDCAPAISNSILSIVETDTWQSLRLGVNGQVALTNRLDLDVDAAYLPYVSFSGNDQHLLRQFVSTETGRGHGAQLEALLSYKLTNNWSLGAGGRYWSAWTNSGSYTQNGGTNAAQYGAERYGVFLQAAYRFGG